MSDAIKSERKSLKKDLPEPLPGDLAMWFFIFAELFVFMIFFASYAYARSQNVALFDTYQKTLDRNIGAINTAFLITGSLFVVLSMACIHSGQVKKARGWLVLAEGMGVGFLSLKIIEFSDKLSHGVSLSTNTFYMFYLSLTFFHFLHVILGMVVLGIMIKAMSRIEEFGVHGIESGAAYWHMIDLVWIVLFPLVYVIH